jgi:hypothetical protein
MDLRQAYERLGLPENATRDMVEKRYDMFLRQERRRRRESGDESESPEFAEITRAYRFIVEQEEKQAVTELNERQYGKYKQFAGLAEKIDHFISYYKWHTIGAILLVALIIYGINSYIEHKEEQARLAALPPMDVYGMMLGQFYAEDGGGETEGIEAAMLGHFPDWKRVELKLLTFSLEPKSELDIAMLQKATVMLATEKPDIYILDADTYPWLARSGVLLELDDLAAGRFASLLPEEAAPKASGGEEAGEHVYGIDLTDSPLIGELPLIKDRFIVGIRRDAERLDNALHLIETYLKSIP